MTDKRNIESSFSFTIGSSFVLALTKIRRPKVSNIYFLEDYTVLMSQSYTAQGIPRKPANGSVSNSFIMSQILNWLILIYIIRACRGTDIR